MRFLHLLCLAGPALAQVSTISSCQTVFTDKALATVKTYGNTESGTTESTRYKTLKSTITVTASPPADKTSVFRITKIVATRPVQITRSQPQCSKLNSQPPLLPLQSPKQIIR
ncbi:unnamed protein product [Cercospora beticola]|nr:unnamed protein product [Cercospora beticola]